MVQISAWKSAVQWFKKLSWRSLRFPALFLVSVALLTLMYRLRSDRLDKEEAEKASKMKSILLSASLSISGTERTSSDRGPMTLWPDEADLSELASHERWVVVSAMDEEYPGLREGRGAEIACSLAAAVKDHGWRAIVIGEVMNCCRLPDCVHLDNALLSRLPYRVLRFVKPNPLPSPSTLTPLSSPRHPPVINTSSSQTPEEQQRSHRSSALRNAAFLFAIQHGARFVFDAYPPDVDHETLTSWAKEIFSSVVLGTSIGLVLDGHSYSFPTSVPGAPTPRVLNPYAHFGRPDLWTKGYVVHDSDEYNQQHLRYRVCEIKQPSVEMFLDVWDGGPADLIAPPITVPSSVLAPYGSRNVLYTRDAFWGLALIPGTGKNSSNPKLSPNLVRALWNYALLGATLDAGGVRFNLIPGTKGAFTNSSNSVISPPSLEEEHSVPSDLKAYIATFTSRVLRWRCRCTTLLPCLSQLASDFLATSLITAEDAAFMDAWVSDLRRVRYLPPPTLPWSPRPPPRPPGPCIHPPHHHHRQLHDPPLPHPTTLTFHPTPLWKPTVSVPASIRKQIARFHRDAALLEWSVGRERTEEEVALVEETLAEDRLLSDEESHSESSSSSKDREENMSRKVLETADKEEKEDTYEEVTDNPSNEETALTRTFLGDVADHLCPGFAPLASPLLPHRPSSLKLENVLLVVWFPRPPRYDLLPTLELLRSRHFPNALFCGPPHRALPSMLSRFESPNTPSFLTATSRSDCLMTALEMGYKVGEQGSLLLVEESALPIPWSLAERNRSLIWFHVENEESLRKKRSPRDSDGKGWDDSGQGNRKTYYRGLEESVITAAEGLASALRYMAQLMGMRPNHHLHPHHHAMEDMDHEETPWNRSSVNVSDNANTTVDGPANETVSTSEDTLLENTTISELLEALQEKLNNTEEIAVVEEIIIKEIDDIKAPAVEHVKTPSVEYSEPTVVEYHEPPLKENHKGDESEGSKSENKKEDYPSNIERIDRQIDEGTESSEQFSSLFESHSNPEDEKKTDADVKDHTETSSKKEAVVPDEKPVDITFVKQNDSHEFDIPFEERVELILNSSNISHKDHSTDENPFSDEKQATPTPEVHVESSGIDHIDSPVHKNLETSDNQDKNLDSVENENSELVADKSLNSSNEKDIASPTDKSIESYMEKMLDSSIDKHSVEKLVDIPVGKTIDSRNEKHYDTPVDSTVEKYFDSPIEKDFHSLVDKQMQGKDDNKNQSDSIKLSNDSDHSTVKEYVENGERAIAEKEPLHHSDKEITEIASKEHSYSPVIEHVDTPAIEYSEPSVMEHFETYKIDPLELINGTFNHQLLEENLGGISEKSVMEVKLDPAEIITVTSVPSLIKHEHNVSTEWTVGNVTTLPWNDNDTKLEPPVSSSSSEWVTSAEAEEILSSITMIENAHENRTEQSKHIVETVTESFVNENVNQTVRPEEIKNSTFTESFEIKSPELYEDEKVEEEVVGDGEQSLLEQDTLLSYKDVEDTPQFVSLPSSTAKSHAKSESSIHESDSAESKRKKRDTTEVNARTDYSFAGFKDQFMRSREMHDDGHNAQPVSARLSRSLEEIEELFAELASRFPDDANAVLREEGKPEILSYPSPHYGLDHTDFRHLHCDYGEMEDGDGDWGESDGVHFEPCTILRRFFLRLYYSHQSEGSLLRLLRLATTQGSAPIFHLPMRLQRELHLTASLLLSQGFPEEAVLPLLVYGLAGEKGWVNLKRTKFGETDGAFPVFDESCDFIYPTNLRLVPEESRLRSVFCLKFLLRVLDG